MNITIRQYTNDDVEKMTEIWNEVVREGIAFPQDKQLSYDEGKIFFAEQTYCGAAVCDDNVYGLYILHPNNVGRCSHICNASYAVKSDCRGMRIGEKLVRDSMKQAKYKGFKIMQFNAVAQDNIYARHLYEKLGFIQLGVIKNGFRREGYYVNICPYYIEL